MVKKEGEEIIYRAKPSRFNFFGSYLGAIIFLILAALPWFNYFSISEELTEVYGHNLLF